MAVTVERLVAEVEANPAGAIAALTAFSAATDRAAQDRTAHIKVETDHSQVDQLTNAMMAAGAAGNSGAGGINNFGGGARSAAYHSANLRSILMGGLGLPAIYGLATGAAGALQMLGAAAAGAASSVGSLAGVLGALPVGLGAMMGGIGATIMGFQGIGGAISAADVVLGASPMSTGQAASNLRAVESATRGVENAYRSLTRAQEQVGKAERDLARARRDAAEQIADAEEAAADRVRAAREWAAGSGERLEDAQFSLANAYLSEKEAVLALEQAQKRLAEVQAGVGKTASDVMRVTDDFTGKTYEIARVSNDAADQQMDQRAAVLALERAQLALLMAQDRVGDSERAMDKARRDHARTPAELAKAEQRAARDVARARESAARSIESAEERVKNAHESVADALRGVEDAQRSLADAQKAGAAAAAGGMAALNKYNEAMAALTPEGREFVEFMVKEFLPAWRDLQKAAQRGLLPGVMAGLRDLMTVFPMLEEQIFNFAKTVGDHFAEFFAHFAQTEEVEKLERVLTGLNEVLGGSTGADGKEMKGLLDAFIPLYDIILSITEAATPMTKLLTDDIVRGLENLASYLDSEEGFSKMQAWFERGYYFGGLFMDVLKPLATVIGDVSEAARPLAEWMLKSMAQYFEDLADTTSSADGMEKMKTFFEDMQEPIKETMGLIRDLLGIIFGAPTDNEDNAYLDLVRGIRENVIPALGELVDQLATSDVGEAMSEFFGNITDLIGQIVEHEGALILVLDIINGIADAFRWLDKATGGKSTDIILGLFAGLGAIKIGGILAKFTGLTTLWKGIGWLFGSGSKGKHAAKGGILGKLFTGLKKVAKLIFPWLKRFAARFVMFLGPVGLAVGIGLLVYEIIKNWDKIKEWTGKALDWLKEKIPAAWNWLVDKTGEAWNWLWEKVSDAWEWVKTKTGEALSWVGDKIVEEWGYIKEDTKAAWDAVWGWIRDVWDWIVEKVTGAAQWVSDKVTGAWNWIKTETGEKWDWIWSKLDEIWTWIKDTVGGAADWVWGKVRDAWNWITDKTTTAWDSVSSWISEKWEGIKTTVKNAKDLVVEWIGDAWDTIETKTEEAWDWVWDKVEGVWDDITAKVNEFIDFAGKLKEKITDATKGAFDGIKDAFKAAFNWIIEKWNGFSFTIPGVNILGKQVTPEYTFSTPDIPLWKQFGGPVEEGKPYIVGEKRPEMFIPNTSGRIAAAVPRTQPMSKSDGITDEQLERILERVLEAAEERNVKIEQTFNEKVDPMQVSRAVARAVKVR